MTQPNTWNEVQILLRKLPFLTQHDIEELPTTKNALWMKLLKLTRNSIAYHFDEDAQNRSNKIFDQLNQLLGTKKASDIKEKGKKKLREFPEIIRKINNELEDQYARLEKEEPDSEEKSEKAIVFVFGNVIPRWTLTEMNEIVERKLERYENIGRKTDEQIKEGLEMERFQEIIADLDADTELVDRLILQRIGENPNDTLNSSTISEVRSFETLNSNDDPELLEIQNNLEAMNLGQEREVEVKENIEGERKNVEVKKVTLFAKKEVRILDDLEEKPKTEIKVERKEEEQKPQEQAPSNNNNVRMNKDELPVFQTQQQNIRQEQEQRIPENNDSTQNSNENHNYTQDISFTQINDSMFEAEDKKQNEEYSEQLIERFSSQSRFTKGIYEKRRDDEVKEIEQNQLQPLLLVLKGLTARHLDKFSQSFEPLGVEVYGSYAHKAGFRKTSDININLTINGIEQRNMQSTFFGLRGLLENYRVRGLLNTLNLRSVIYSEEHQEVILSHKNNETDNKKREPNKVNFIYLTINRIDYVLSSRFIGQVVYSGEDKATDIANLTNLVHLLFKGNNILDHKDIYHVWWTKTPYERERKRQSQSRYVSLPIYAMHMMILFYLQQEGIIKIKFSNEKNSFTFDLLNHEITLFEMFGGFLRFYSSKGSYVENYVGSVVEVVENKSGETEKRLLKLIESNSHKMQSKDHGYLFVFVHPVYDQLISMNPEKCLSFQLERGSNEEQLFFSTIDKMLNIVANLNPGKKFEPNELFRWNNSLFE